MFVVEGKIKMASCFCIYNLTESKTSIYSYTEGGCWILVFSRYQKGHAYTPVYWRLISSLSESFLWQKIILRRCLYLFGHLQASDISLPASSERVNCQKERHSRNYRAINQSKQRWNYLIKDIIMGVAALVWKERNKETQIKTQPWVSVNRPVKLCYHSVTKAAIW